MSTRIMLKSAIAALGTVVALGTVQVRAQEASSLDELLDLVKQGQVVEAKENRDRERRFTQAKADQQRLLNEARAERKRQEDSSARLEKDCEDNELLVADKQEQLKERLGYHHKQRQDALVIVQADTTTPHGKVVEVMDLARQVGFESLAIATESN